MKKTGLIDRISDAENVSRAEAKKRLENLLFIIRDSLVIEGEVVLTGIGKIRVVEKPAGEVRNPRTGEKKYKEASRSVKFTTSSLLKKDVQTS